MTEPPRIADDKRDAALQLLLAEYQFVAGLIPFYRGVEMRALGGTGLVLSGVAAAIAGLESAETPKVAAEATLLVLAAWIPAFLLLVEIMALTRLRRASLYIAHHLQPIAAELVESERLLRWELEPSKELLERLRSGERRSALPPLIRESTVKIFASSTPLIVAIAGVSVLLAGAGWVRGGEVDYLLLGGPAALFAVVVGAFGVAFTSLHEGRLRPQTESPGPPGTPAS